MKPRCENCRHHKLAEQPDSWMVVCTEDGCMVHRWYRCEGWRDENMNGNKCCENCRNHVEVFGAVFPDFEEAECPYVTCSITGKIVPKWDDCDDWEAKDDD